MKASRGKPEAGRMASRPKHIEPVTAVWVWDGSWWPATVTRALFHRGERLLIVRLEHGLTVPASPSSLEPRDPDLGGADKPNQSACVVPQGQRD
jgi:hypothetical protein